MTRDELEAIKDKAKACLERSALMSSTHPAFWLLKDAAGHMTALVAEVERLQGERRDVIEDSRIAVSWMLEEAQCNCEAGYRCDAHRLADRVRGRVP